MRRFTTLLFAMLLGLGVQAQINLDEPVIVLCEDFDTASGQPIGIYQIWDIPNDGNGGYIYIVYMQKERITEELSLFVDKKDDSGEIVFFDFKEFENDVSWDPKNWAIYDMKFMEEGSYRFTVMGANREPLAVSLADIQYVKSDSDSETVVESEDEYWDEVDTYYYEESWVSFGESLQDGELINESTSFQLKGRSMEITAMLEMEEALRLSLVYVEVYTGEEYEEEVSSISYDIEDEEWNWISVPIEVKKPGSYVVDFYNQDDIFINTATFEIY